MTEQKAVHVIVDGRVQGVCFRMETRRAALGFNVKGWVRNLPDGSVEGVFEGDPGDVDLLVDWCRKGPALAMVSNIRVTERKPEGYGDFSIRR